MIIGIGTDLVCIARIDGAIRRFGDRFLRRIFTDAEILHCTPGPTSARLTPSACHARRFAAKEAVVKAMGTGVRDGIWFRDIEVQNDTMGRPMIVTHGPTSRWMQSLGVTHTHLSLSDDSGFALAMVVLERIP
jgi:holo-[acyl-carrier protein] synthase